MFRHLSLIILSPIKRIKRSNLRRMMRGYRILKKTGRLELVEDAIQSLRLLKLPIDDRYFSRILLGNALESAELIVRQRISSKYIRLHESLLIASSARDALVVAPMPPIWRNQLKRLGFRINNFQCELLWQLEIFYYLIYGIGVSVISFVMCFPLIRVSTIKFHPYIFLCDLSSGNLPINGCNYHSSCISNWYMQSQKSFIGPVHIKHSVSDYQAPKEYASLLTYQNHPIPNSLSFTQWFLYSLLLIKSLASAAESFIKGRWWNIIVYHESVISLRVRLLASELIAKEYWFHNSRYYRPLWTYELEAKGSQAVYYFYGINIYPLPRSNGTTPFNTPYSIMNWSKYILWSKYHEAFLDKCIPHNYTSIVAGPIPFTDNNEAITFPSGINIAVFDVTPVRSSFYQKLALNHDLYTPAQVESFILQIVDISSRLNCNLLLKSKRNIRKLAHPRYRSLIKDLYSKSQIYHISPDVSAFRLVKGVDFTISFPFTSTAYIAKAYGIPSVYFCPSGCMASELPLKSPDPSIKLLTDYASLFQWLLCKIQTRTST